MQVMFIGIYMGIYWHLSFKSIEYFSWMEFAPFEFASFSSVFSFQGIKVEFTSDDIKIILIFKFIESELEIISIFNSFWDTYFNFLHM